MLYYGLPIFREQSHREEKLVVTTFPAVCDENQQKLMQFAAQAGIEVEIPQVENEPEVQLPEGYVLHMDTELLLKYLAQFKTYEPALDEALGQLETEEHAHGRQFIEEHIWPLVRLACLQLMPNPRYISHIPENLKHNDKNRIYLIRAAVDSGAYTQDRFTDIDWEKFRKRLTARFVVTLVKTNILYQTNPRRHTGEHQPALPTSVQTEEAQKPPAPLPKPVEITHQSTAAEAAPRVTAQLVTQADVQRRPPAPVQKTTAPVAQPNIVSERNQKALRELKLRASEVRAEFDETLPRAGADIYSRLARNEDVSQAEVDDTLKRLENLQLLIRAARRLIS